MHPDHYQFMGPETTRSRILQAAHEEMYEHGFQGLRIDAVLKRTGLAKGALYHYFPTKFALGYAVVDEVILGYFHFNWGTLLDSSHDPLQAMKGFFKRKCDDIESGECPNGCPLTNLVQEMSVIDEGFHQRLKAVMMNIVGVVSQALQQGQADGIVRKDIEPQRISAFLLSSYQGIMGTAKCMKSMDLAKDLFGSLCDYVDTLRCK